MHGWYQKAQHKNKTPNQKHRLRDIWLLFSTGISLVVQEGGNHLCSKKL